MILVIIYFFLNEKYLIYQNQSTTANIITNRIDPSAIPLNILSIKSEINPYSIFG
jgi:hypothetical protein